MHGKILGDTYIKKEDESQKLRMGGNDGSWTINLKEISPSVRKIHYLTKRGRYKIDLELALEVGFKRKFTTNGLVEEKLVVPIKHWVFEEDGLNLNSRSVNDRDFSKYPTLSDISEK